MLLVISPAKTLDFETKPVTKTATQPDFLADSALLIDELRELAPQDISALMSISDKLGVLNFDRFQQWSPPFSADNAKQAVLAFKGDVYTGLEAESFSRDEFKFAQNHLRILSGLYGVLRPLDLMQAYRLEMGTKFANRRGKDLYQFWGDKVTDALNTQLGKLKSEVLVNLASNEYFKAVSSKKIAGRIVTPVFKDLKNGDYKIISFYAKKARGMMAAWIIRNQITDVEQLVNFNVGGYQFSKALSKGDQWVFTRDHAEESDQAA
ncbi:peroxide stress protein YaaA [Halioxenophilus sp. WMMB6]|uniref:peroxide stress protein YaaA n=1 Tax=Halioxenophilus sp. WMMB6 TaxID=3073815 RepID=UPI00295E7D16|nr:peroxide stress protein YaaA [Halioxenophilus sp. WMMB6]